MKQIPVNAPNADMAIVALRTEMKRRGMAFTIVGAHPAPRQMSDNLVAITVTNRIDDNVTFIVLVQKMETVQNDS